MFGRETISLVKLLKGKQGLYLKLAKLSAAMMTMLRSAIACVWRAAPGVNSQSTSTSGKRRIYLMLSPHEERTAAVLAFHIPEPIPLSLFD